MPGASNPAVQSDPSVALDGEGGLYWVSLGKPHLNAPSRLRHVFGRAR